MKEPILQVRRLKKKFALGKSGPFSTRSQLIAVDDVSFAVNKGEIFGLVGESGCGKSTIARCIVRLTEPTSGQIIFEGVALDELEDNELRRLRGRLQIVFQDPTAALDPRMRILEIVEEPLLVHGDENKGERRKKAEEILRLVGIKGDILKSKPHGLSGGQRQRVALARSLVLYPDLLILDEPTSALDVSVQAQVLNLLRDVQERLDLTYVFIVHDLAVAEHFCDHLAVLYLGAVMEMSSRDEIFRSPLHPYTVALLSAAPSTDPSKRARSRRIILEGEVPQMTSQVKGCRFKDRCPVGRDRTICGTDEPPLREVASNHWISCHFPGELRPPGVSEQSEDTRGGRGPASRPSPGS